MRHAVDKRLSPGAGKTIWDDLPVMVPPSASARRAPRTD